MQCVYIFFLASVGMLKFCLCRCQIGSVWLKAILQIHAGLLISNPELPELLGAALGNIEQRLTLLTPLMRLKGRINLLLPQVCGYSNNDANEEEAPLFTYNDKGNVLVDYQTLHISENFFCTTIQ